MASVPGIPPASRDANPEQQKSVDDIWHQVQAKVVQLAGGDAKNIRKLGIDDVLKYLDSFQSSKKPEKLQRLKGAVDKTLQCIQTVGSVVSSGVSTVFGPADICCNALTFVIQAWQGYEGIFENLAELLEKCMEFLDRLVYYNEKMDTRLLRVACQNLQLFVDICDRTIKLRRKHTRFLAFTKMLFLNDDGIQDLLGLMDRLNSKESLLVAAQTFEVVSDSATQIKAMVQGQKEQRNTQDAKERRKIVVDALGFRPTELGNKGEPIATWKSSFDQHKNTIIATTGEWLWQDSVFLDWSRAAQPQAQVLVLQGENGSGKSLMMANAIRHLQKEDGPTSRIVTAYSFTERDSKSASQDPQEYLEAASKALLWQLAVSFEAMTKSMAQIAQASSGFDGWLDVWDQLFINNSERLNPDTTFFIFVDGIETDMRGFVPLFQKLCSGKGIGKVRIMLTAGPRMMAECNHHMKDVKFEAISLALRNLGDIEKYISYRMDSMPTLRDPTRPGISDWRKRILGDLSVKCAGDYYKLDSSLSALSQMDLIEDIESVLADANKTRSSQIDAEIANLNSTRTPKEIQEINDIILWVDSGRRWFPVDMLEALISMRHQPGSGSGSAGDLPNQSATASQGAALTVSLLPLSQKLREKYPLFDVTKTNLVKWRTPETKDRIPSRMAPEERTILGRPRIQQTEINIVRHFLHNVCPEEMYDRFDFESFLASRIGAERQECICRDPDNAHIKIAIAYLTVMTDETIKDIGNTTQYARRDLLYHLKQVDLSAADKDYKVQVGLLLVRLLTEEKGVTSLFLPTASMPLWQWAITEYNHFTEIRAEWLYSTEGTREISRWFNDATVTKSIQGDLATSFVQGIKSADGNLHRLVLSHAAKYLARKIFLQKATPAHTSTACLFLRGYLLRCDPEISTQMANDASFYISKETDAAKELEDPKNFTVNTFRAIETWAANALGKSEGSPTKDCEWELRAFYLMYAVCQGVPKKDVFARAIEAARLDPTHLEARYVAALDEDMEHRKGIEMLSQILKELQTLERADTLIQARATVSLGHRLWDLGEDYELAAQTHLEALRYGHFGLQSRMTYYKVFVRYKEDFVRFIAFINGLNNCTAAWTPLVDELIVEMISSLAQARQIAEVADKNQQWDILKTFYKTATEHCDRLGFVELAFALRRLLADTLDYSTDEEQRKGRVVLYETGLEGIKDDDQAKGNIGTFIIYLAVDNLAAAYAEKAFASDASPETVELYISKLAELLAFAENDEESLRAVTPVCCLIRHRRDNDHHYADLTQSWTRRIMLEIIELLSDDDEDNDYNAYLYLYQTLIALGDFGNSRVAVAMLKWVMHLRYVRREERKLSVIPGYATIGFEKSKAVEGDAGRNSKETGKTEPLASLEVGTEAVGSDDGAPAASGGMATEQSASLSLPTSPEEELDEDNSSKADVNAGGQHTDVALFPTPEPEKSVQNDDKSPLMWLSFCDCCEVSDIAQDHPMYVCIDCVQTSFTDGECYAKMNRGEKLEVDSGCKGHKCFFVPPWKPDVEFPPGSVPVFRVVGDADDEVEFDGWMAMDLWKSELRKLYIDN